MQLKTQQPLNWVYPYFQSIPQHKGKFFLLIASVMGAFFLPKKEGIPKRLMTFLIFKQTK